ncbi:MBL fold metallo-hydrolase, partial [Candidatus Sumerlaeota bacterium]|nr:MBL fold metallo-hydrolase [Candidatus Sumerlaeota bacterium]
GQLWDLYSLQDAIPAAKIGGYHGYAARLADTTASLERLAAAHPDILVPARGPVIRAPAEAIAKLTQRIRDFYANYLSIDALRWYFGDEHIMIKARRVLGPQAKVAWMEMAETVQDKLPAWVIPIANGRLIQAADGSGFMIDCGGQRILDDLKKRYTSGTLKSLGHIFITHYHNDHTDYVPDLVEFFGAKVYACEEMIGVLEHPEAYRLPAMTSRPIRVSMPLEDEATWRWKEFEMTLYYFPGQTLYHQALLVKKDKGESICFIGDSFTPSGIDDYCLLNRNFLHDGMGYFYCLDLVKRLPADCLLINQHVPPAFRFSAAQIGQMESTLKKRIELLRDLAPWDDPNFALDEGWARFQPYAVEARPGATFNFAVVIMNHSADAQYIRVRLNFPPDWTSQQTTPVFVRIPPRQERMGQFAVTLPDSVTPGLYVLTADIDWGDKDLREWAEMMVEVVR